MLRTDYAVEILMVKVGSVGEYSIYAIRTYFFGYRKSGIYRINFEQEFMKRKCTY